MPAKKHLNTTQKYVTLTEAAEILDVNIATVRRWTNSGKLASARTAGGHRRLLKNDIEKILLKKQRKAAAKNLSPIIVSPVTAQVITPTVSAISAPTLPDIQEDIQNDSVIKTTSNTNFQAETILSRFSQPPIEDLYIPLHTDQKNIIRRTGRFTAVLALVVFTALGIKGFQKTFAYSNLYNSLSSTPLHNILPKPNEALAALSRDNKQGRVLQSANTIEDLILRINVPVNINNDATISGNLTINGDLITQGATELLTGLTTTADELNVFSGMTLTSGGVLYSTSTNVDVTAAGTSNQVLVSQGTSAPVWKTVTSLFDLPEEFDGDADTLDGLNSTAFLRSNADDSFESGYVLTIAGDLIVSDTAIVFDGATTKFTTTGDLTLDIGGGDLIFTDTQVINIGGSASDVAYNVIGDSTSGASASMTSDDDLYLEGNLEVDGQIIGSLSGGLTTTLDTGSVTFIGASQELTGDSTNFFWDDSSDELGIGTNSPSYNLHVAGTAGLLGNTTIGDANTDDITVTGEFVSSLVPNANNTYDLGSTLKRWSTVYGVNANFTNLSSSSTDIAGTTSQDFTINTDNATIDTEDATLTFDRGSEVTNAEIRWDSSPNYWLSTNAPTFFVNGSTDLTYSGKAALMVNQVQSQDIFTASASGTTRFTIANDGSLTSSTTDTTTNAFNFTADSLTTGNGINGSFDGLTTGNGMYLESTSTAFSSGNLASLYWNPGSSTTATGDLLRLNVGSNGIIGNIFNVMDNSSSVFSISQSQVTTSLPVQFNSPGDVSMAYDLNFTNQTASYIKSNAPLYIEAGETFENNDLTLRTYGTGNLVADLTGTGELQLVGTDTTIILDTRTATDTDFWLGVVDDGGSDDDDIFQIGDGTTPGTNPFLTIDTSGNVGIGDTSPDAKLEVLATSEQLRLTYTDGSADSRFSVSSTGDLTIDNLGSGTSDQLVLGDADTLNIGGSGSTDVAYNVIGDSTSGASGSMDSDDDLYIEGSLEVDGTIIGATVSATDLTCTDCLDFTDLEDTLDLDAALVLNQGTNTWTQNYTGTTSTGYSYVADSVTTANAVAYSFDGLTSGTGMYLESTSTAFTSGNLASMYWNPGSSTSATGDLLRLNVGANGIIGNIFNVMNNSSSVFSVSQTQITAALPTQFTAAGDVSIAYDLQFTNQTASYIKSLGPLTIQSGESFENNNLALVTYGTGNVVLDMTAGTGELQIVAPDPTIILDTETATDTDFWLGVVEDAGGDDDDTFQIGDGTTPGSNTFFTLSTAGDTTLAGDLAVNGGDITTTQTTATLLNTTATTLSLGGAATTALNLGNGTGNYTAINIGSSTGTHTINIAGTGATAADTINIGTGGTGADTINIGSSASTTAINLTSGTGVQAHTSSVVSGTTSTSAFTFTGNALTTGTGLYTSSTSLTQGKLAQFSTGSANTLTTGTLVDVRSTATSLTGAAGTGSLLNLDWTPGSATTATGDLLAINVGSNGIVGNIFNVLNASSSVFSVGQAQITSALPHQFTAAGDVSIAYDLIFTNQTASYIKSNAPLYIEAGETFENNPITIKTYGTGNIIAETSGTGDFQLTSADPTILLDTKTATDTDFWISVQEDAGADDDDTFQIGDGTTAGTNPFLVLNTSGSFGIGADTTPDYQLEVNAAASSDPALALTDGDVAHGLTTLANTDVIFHIAPISSTDGGTQITAISDNAVGAQALNIRGVIGNTDPTDTVAAVKIVGGKASGTTIGDLGTDETVFQVANNDDTAAITVLGDGATGVGTVSPLGMLHVAAGNAATYGKALAIFDHDESQHLITASASGVTKFAIAHDGKVFIGDNTTLGTSTALCWETATLNGATVYQVGDCTGTPADYAERYPVEANTSYGDIVSIGTQNVTQTDGQTVKKLVKSSKAYDSTVLGIVSDNYHDFTSAGSTSVNASDNPMPVALAGRVPVKVSSVSSAIKAGDFITTSVEAGKAMKAERAGMVIGKALEDWSPTSGKETVMVFVNNTYSMGNLADSGELSTGNETAATDSDEDLALLISASESAALRQEIGELKGSMDTIKNDLALLTDTIVNEATASAVLGSSISTIEEATVSSLMVTDKLLTHDLGITGKVSNGLLVIDGLQGDIHTLAGLLTLQNSLTIDTKGNLTLEKGVITGNNSFRDSANLPAGQTKIRVNKTWDVPPTTINITPSYLTVTAVTNITKDGFTIEVLSPSSKSEKLYWVAIW